MTSADTTPGGVPGTTRDGAPDTTPGSTPGTSRDGARDINPYGAPDAPTRILLADDHALVRGGVRLILDEIGRAHV